MPSKKILETKKQAVNEISILVKDATSIVLADYRGLTVEQDTELRNLLRKSGVEYRVLKNTLLRFAVRENGLEALECYLEGPTAIAFSKDPVAPAKVLAEFAKKNVKLELKGGVVEGKIIDANGVRELADLPSKEVLVARVLGSLNAPITGLVNVLNGNLRGLAVALNAIKEKKSA